MSEYSEAAERLAREMWTAQRKGGHRLQWWTELTPGAQAVHAADAQALIDAGWQPPPDTADAIARKIRDRIDLAPKDWDPVKHSAHRSLLAAVREHLTKGGA